MTVERLPDDWRHQGNPRISVWCRRCQCRVIPLTSGICGWCDTPVSRREPRRTVVQPVQQENAA